MRPRTNDEMDLVVRAVVRDCVQLFNDSGLRISDLARLLGITRPTLYKWVSHPIDEWKTLPCGGKTSATLFLNLLIARDQLRRGFASGHLPVTNQGQANRWTRQAIGDAPR